MKLIGEIGELKFLTKATERGFIVSKPYGETQYDFLLDHKGYIHRVQVKTTSKTSDRYGGYAFTTAFSDKQSYTRDHTDLIVCYVSELDIFYLIPVKFLTGHKNIKVYPTKNNSKWDFFKEKWTF